MYGKLISPFMQHKETLGVEVTICFFALSEYYTKAPHFWQRVSISPKSKYSV